MKEKVKSLLLLFLVLTSVYLTYKLWISFPQNELSFINKKSTNAKVDIFRIIRPEYTFVGIQGKVYLVSNGDFSFSLWKKTADFINSNKEEKINVVDDNSWENAQKGTFIRFLIGKSVNGDLLKDIFTNRDSWFRKINSDIYVEEIIVNIDKNQIFIKDATNKKFYCLNYLKMEILKNIIENLPKDKVSVCESVYEEGNTYFEKNVYIPSLTFSIKEIYNKETNFESDHHFLEKFFTNISVVRKITENSGCTVYTDGLKSLRLYQNGYVEFYNTISEPSSTDKNFALKKSIVFLEEIGIKVDDIYLMDFKEEKGEYTFYFNYIFDYPLRILQKEMPDFPIEINILNGNIKYARVLYLDLMSNGNYLISHAKLKQSLVMGIKHISWQQPLSDLKIGYAYYEGQFIPVWIVKSNNREFFINIFDGKLIYNGV
ncbi:Two-component signal transduction system YycFG, regulatory protein YycH [Thermoanaerobacter uzonensis DSM 18761]|jgi:regulatory protein YycH of two-component signal transduction system YycFG|uniref:Two-component signal transduction system YycFG, regulatory protein YycH n=1 Tax=Thermoanaerobacter uzonensis DSM 18761 TaxID=1123369 RepID=A0A1M4ZVI2_9THEO|nr:two-component system activity regulator YycH [Thermoanaerobacter uzonensis]SHF21762.1 Two-component signal transduction system YycFG, regulatory protein YycH [Thermoanaerobacter uzonensis DSM 18761]